MKTKALLASLIVLVSAQVADPISELSRYKTWGREVLTHHDLNALQDHFATKINDVISVAADSHYVRMTADTLTVAHSVTVDEIEVSKGNHTHVDSHYIKTEIDTILMGGSGTTNTLSTTGYAVFSHGHTAGTIHADHKTGTGKFVFSADPALTGTPTIGGQTIWHAGLGGVASGLHADLLDLKHGSYYAATGATGAVQFRKSNPGEEDDGSFESSLNFIYTLEAGSGTSQLSVGSTPRANMELTIGQPSGATTNNTEVWIGADTGESGVIIFGEGDNIRQQVTMKGADADNRMIIGPDDTNGNGINIASNGKVGIEASAVDTADLALGTHGLQFGGTVEPFNFVQKEPFQRLDGSMGYNSPSSGDRTVSKTYADLQITRAFTRGQGVIAYDNQTDPDEGMWLTIVDDEGNFRFYHDTVADSDENGVGTRLMVHKFGITVNSHSPSDATSAYALKVSGDAYTSGTLTENSDARYKENSQSLTGALDKVKTLDAFTYQLKADSPIGKIWADQDSTVKEQYLGVSAQELKAVYPDLVKGSDAVGYSVNYTRLTVVLLASIKELEARVAALEGE